MLLIFKKVLFLVGLTLYIICTHSQTVTSTRNGVWTDPATWVGGIVPTSVTATQTIINHEVELPETTTVSVFRVVVNGKLTLKSSATLDVLDDGISGSPDLQVFGTFVMEDGSFCNGTSSINTRFEAGSFYFHQQGPLGFIPYATWDRNSTFIINGFKASGYINIAHSDSWKQTFGIVVYNCPEQSGFVDLNGYLRNIQGDFTIVHTRNQALRLSTTQNPVISIGGNLKIEGPSQVWMSTNGNSATVNVQGDFIYTSTALCYLTTRGRISVSIGGNLNINTPSVIRMTSLSSDSVGIREASININEGLSIIAGVIAAPPSGNGKGVITFNGLGLQPVISGSNGESFLGNLDFVIESNATVNLGNSVLSNTSGSLIVKGTLQVGSSDPLGAVQLTNKGNIHISGARTFEPGSAVEYNGTNQQYIGDGHPASSAVHLICNNSSTVTMLQDVSVNDFSVQKGSFLTGMFTLNVDGDFHLDPSATITAPLIRLTGNQDQNIFASGNRLTNLTINKTGGAVVTLTSPLILDGLLQIESENIDFRSNGFLTLASSSDNAGGTASVGALPSGSAILGEVTVERFMSGEGRIYRYISSAVTDATVADLMDDFPITGRFADPSSGPGINSSVPSFYHYDESVGGLQEGWRPYPVIGSANANLLQQGRGYAAFIRNGTGSTIWDVTGILNQGEIQLPVAFTPNGAPSNGWNLVGNPYACTIDWDINGSTGWTKQNISHVISIRDNGGGSGMFRYWDGDINYSDIPNGHIASGQSIWVRATGTNPSLIIREGVKAPNSAAFYREETPLIPSFAVIVRKDSLSDKAFFKVRQGATSGLDDWDAVK
ncbi:MAG: hypothetical protein C0490_03040, partial [Marivirga sp.]|nr:hypothetical protein [Marivirga sp.]